MNEKEKYSFTNIEDIFLFSQYFFNKNYLFVDIVIFIAKGKFEEVFNRKERKRFTQGSQSHF
ncbi:hypothetical protein [Flavobacterium sharifuzzamanii]|uniref:hypothetical protein n=1 Tax=Flavobacterium sharifuzzamanii TaxID=2211133 RepID=UPI000DACB991|nr:hypothetical protein [Flavobacterium sharifuzzamanii]KAF2079499.1 hypothetical protein DMA14_18315 [Flavobacterium sharifuzzamanii]